MPKLLVNEGGQAALYELFEDEATIGRGASNAIQVADGHASKHHAVVRRVAGRMKLVDLESKNGTRVNGEFRNQRWLQHGDAISIGAAVLTYDGAEGAAAAEGGAHEAERAPAAAYAAASAAPAAPVSSRGGRTSSRRSRDRDEAEDDDGERRRAPARRSNNSTGVALLVGGGLVAFVALLIVLLGGKGNSPNVQALQAARAMSAKGGKENAQQALDHLTMYGDPADADGYQSVAREIGLLKEKLLAFDDTDLEAKAAKEYNAIERAFIEKHMNGRTEASIGADLVKWVDTYKEFVSGGQKLPGRQVGAFLAGYKNPNLLKLYNKAAGK